MYRTLQLGFVGQYRAQDDERREDIVRARRTVPAFTLAQDAPIVARASRLRSGRRWYWLSWVVAVSPVALWFFLSSSLTGLVSQIVRPG
jgi:type VI secretion system protein ImpK